MCRWGCESLTSTFMCKWCGTWFCRECLRGAYPGLAKESLTCRVCNQKKCQGTKVDFPIRLPPTDNDSGGKGSKSASSARGRSASPSKSAGKSSKGSKSAGKKSGGGKKGGKKTGKKKKKK